jgi:hypothetical protein
MPAVYGFASLGSALPLILPSGFEGAPITRAKAILEGGRVVSRPFQRVPRGARWSPRDPG